MTDWDWTLLKSPNPSHRLDIQLVTAYCHGLDIQTVTGLDDRPIRDIRMSRFGHRPIRSGLDNRK